MKRPRKVSVGPFPYKLIWDQAKLDRAGHVDGEAELNGYCDANKLEILVRPDLPHERIRETLCHELLHAMFNAAGISDELKGDKEERLVNRLSPLFFEVVRGNAEVIRWLTT